MSNPPSALIIVPATSYELPRSERSSTPKKARKPVMLVTSPNRGVDDGALQPGRG